MAIAAWLASAAKGLKTPCKAEEQIRDPGTLAAVQTRATVFLDERGIAWEGFEYDHDPSAESFGMEAAELLGLDPAVVFKTLVTRLNDSKGPMAVGIVPVSDQMSLKGLARAAHAKRAVMAEVPHAERATGYVAGGISPFGYVSGGRRGFDIAVSPGDLISVLDAIAAPIAAG